MKTKRLFFILAFFLMLFQFTYRNPKNINYSYVDSDTFSDTLISGTIYAEHCGISKKTWSSLGRFSGLLGDMYSYECFLTDQNWESGYNREKPIILLKNTTLTKKLFKIGNKVEFNNAEIYKINNIIDYGNNLGISLETEKKLSEKQQGSLFNIKLLDSEGKYLPLGTWNAYYSQFGLHGKIFRKVSKYLPFDKCIDIFHFILGLLTAIVLILICYFIYLKFDILFAVIFYFVFLLSPWVVGFSQNLYWIEFSLFMPLLCGLVCSYKSNEPKTRILCYISSFILIFAKSLCGYEYLTTILISLVTFPFMDFVMGIITKDVKAIKQNLIIVFILGMSGVLGFCSAFIIHSYYLGGYDILQGLKLQKSNAIRRMVGIGSSFLSGRELEALYATRLETVALYFKWHTEIIYGISGNLFSIFSTLPIFIFISDYAKQKIDWKFAILYVITACSTISWLFLMKNHSYVHTHLNYILWYFGFIQVCFYIVVKKCYTFLKGVKE